MTIKTQKELDAILAKNGCAQVQLGDGMWEIRGSSAPTIVASGSSAPRIVASGSSAAGA